MVVRVDEYYSVCLSGRQNLQSVGQCFVKEDVEEHGGEDVRRNDGPGVQVLKCRGNLAEPAG